MRTRQKSSVSGNAFVATAALAAAAFAAISCCTPAGQEVSAAPIYWNGTGTSWNSTTSWSTASNATTPNPSAVPASGDSAYFNITTVNTAQTVNLNAGQSAGRLNFQSSGAVTLLGGNGTQTLTLYGDGSAGDNVMLLLNPIGSPVTIGSTTTGQAVNIVLDGSIAGNTSSNTNDTIIMNSPGTTSILNSISAMAATGDTTTLNLQNNNNSNGGSLIISGLVSDGANGGQLGISAGFPGTVFLANNNNTFTGRLYIGQGSTVNVSSLSNYGVASAIGASTGDTANTVGLVIGGTLKYTGSTAQSTNRNIQIAAPVATIDASGGNPSATLNFTHNSANINLFPNFNARTLDLTGSNTGRNTFSIWLTDFNDPTSLTKSGTGTWVLNATGNGTSTGDSYSGATTVNAGTLLVDSAIVSSPFTVDSAATLAGDGSVGGPIISHTYSTTTTTTTYTTGGSLTVNTGGILAPGDNAISATTLTAAGGTALANGSILDFTLGSPNVSGGTLGSDLLKTTSLTLGTGITVNLTQGAGFGLGTYSLIDYSGALTGNFTGWTVTGLSGGETGVFSIGTDNGGNAVQLTIAAVPEPTTLALLTFAGAGLLLAARRRRPA